MCGESGSFFIPFFLMHLFQAKDIKQYGADATSFSPKLLSCAAAVRECSKAGTFETVLDWTTVSDQDQRIKAHPQFQKTVGYSPPNDNSPGKQLGPVVQEDNNITDQPGTTTVEVQPTLLTPLAPASVSPSPPSPPLPPPPAPKHNPFVPGHVKRKLANDATKSQELAPKRKKQVSLLILFDKTSLMQCFHQGGSIRFNGSGLGLRDRQ
jgi:hypothetical protein